MRKTEAGSRREKRDRGRETECIIDPEHKGSALCVRKQEGGLANVEPRRAWMCVYDQTAERSGTRDALATDRHL